MNVAFENEPRVVCQVNIAQLTFIQSKIPERMSSDCLALSSASGNVSNGFEQIVVGAVQNLLGFNPMQGRDALLTNLQINHNALQRGRDSGVQERNVPLTLALPAPQVGDDVAYRPAQSGGPGSGLLPLQDQGVINVGNASSATPAVAEAPQAAVENTSTPVINLPMTTPPAEATADAKPQPVEPQPVVPQPVVPQQKDGCLETFPPCPTLGFILFRCRIKDVCYFNSIVKM